MKAFDLLIETGDFTNEELQISIKSSQNNKVIELNQIPAEAWKSRCLIVCNKKYHGDAPSIRLQEEILPLLEE